MKKWLILGGTVFIVLILLKKNEEFEEYVEELGEDILKKAKGLYDHLYQKWGELRKLDWKLLKAVSIIESSENPNAIGDDGRSFGIMQVGLVVGSSYGMTKNDLFDPNLNIQVGSGFLKLMIDKYGLEGGIQAYNLGETKYRKGLKSPTYLKKVLNCYEELKTQYG